MTDKAKLLGRVRMYDFALVEVIEYLDGHPDNAAALKYYNEMRTAFDKAAAEHPVKLPDSGKITVLSGDADRPRGGYPQRTLDVDRRSVAVGRS